MTPEERITRDELMSLLEYSPRTGIFTWKPRPRKMFRTKNAYNTWNARYANNKSGTILTNGRSGNRYIALNIYGYKYTAHRLAWLFAYGEWPDVIDHVNGDGTDNRISNLRSVSLSDNAKNTRIPKNNKSGIIGVIWHSRRDVWQSDICSAGKRHFLGYFNDFFEACCARKSAEYRHGFHVNHGRSV